MNKLTRNSFYIKLKKNLSNLNKKFKNLLSHWGILISGFYIEYHKTINKLIGFSVRFICKVDLLEIITAFDQFNFISGFLSIIWLICTLDFENFRNILVLHMAPPRVRMDMMDIEKKETIVKNHVGFDGNRPILTRYSEVNKMLEAWDTGTNQEIVLYRLAVVELGLKYLTNISSRTMGDIPITAVVALSKTNYDGAAAQDITKPLVGGLNGRPFHASSNPFGGNGVGRSQCNEALVAHLRSEVTKARSNAMNINNILN